MLIFHEPLFAVTLNVSEVTAIFNSTSSITDEAIPKSMNVMWDYALNGGLYKWGCGLGIFIAVFGVGFWSLKFYKALQESTLLPTVNELVWPLLIVLLMSNGGLGMRNASFGARDLINNLNNSAYKVVDLDMSYQAAFKAIARTSIDGFLMESMYNACEANIDQAKLIECLSLSQTLMDNRFRNRFNSLSSAKPEVLTAINSINERQKEASNQKVAKAKKKDDKGSVAETAGVATPSDVSKVFNANRIIDGKNASDLTFQKNMLALRKAFLYILEVYMLVQALVGPIFLGLSMFPVGTKPLVSWAAMFLATGFCKICYTMISGLSAVAMVLTGPDNIDMSVFAIIVGGIAPILSVTITSMLLSSFSGSINSIAYPAQGYGVNAGLTSGAPPGQPPSADNGRMTGSGGGNKGAK
jgi:hypothetical protein